jgi:3-oxoadipate enol-lactonase
MPFVTSSGARIYWQEYGSGQPVLLIMGLSFSSEMWFRILPELQASFRILIFDNRGIGQSDVPRGPYTIRQMAADAVAVMDAANMPVAHVVGASMGGMIAQELALRYPQRVLSLALACTSSSGLFGKWPNFRRGPTSLAWFRADQVTRERAFRHLLYAQHTPEHLIEEDVRVRLSCNWTFKGVMSQLSGILLWSSYRRLPQIKVPTLVMHGEEDQLLPPENGRVVASRIPGARFHLLPKAGHMLTTDQREITLQCLLDFLAEVGGLPQQPLTSAPSSSDIP